MIFAEKITQKHSNTHKINHGMLDEEITIEAVNNIKESPKSQTYS